MRHSILLPLTALLLIGCGEETGVQQKSHNSTVIINQIEKSITQKDTNLGCKDKGHADDQACTQEEDAAKFILSTLAKESTDESKPAINAIKENLNRSLDEIAQQERNREKIKEELVALVETSNPNRGKELQRFINKIEGDNLESIEEEKLGNTTSRNLSSIKEELNSLIASQASQRPSKEVKERLQDLISNITESKNNLSQTKVSLTNLVKETENNNSPSAKKFANAIIEDVSNNKISIVKEDEHYFIIKVQEGDNLSLLAQRYYNDTDKYELIYQANKDKINKNYQIYPGSTLLIPKL